LIWLGPKTTLPKLSTNNKVQLHKSLSKSIQCFNKQLISAYSTSTYHDKHL
jgi:hypothetical protein